MDETNVILKGVNGDWATNSYGPKETDSHTAAFRPMSSPERSLVLTLDGDVNPSVLKADADKLNDQAFAIPKGCLITDVFVHSDTGVAALNVGVFDKNGAGTNAGLVSAAAIAGGGWHIARAKDISLGAVSALGFALAAGERATVIVKYLPTEPRAEGGVLAKAR